jgi:type I restriction-modification system DNA methylase subunit
MLTGEIRSQVDTIWNAFWTGGISNPLEVIEQITYLLFLRTIPTPALLAKVVDLIDQVPMDDRDTKGDLYEYMLGKIASAGQNGQFRTPRHIIKLMLELTAPTPKDIICDPASGTCGFLVEAGEYLRSHYPEIFRDAALKAHFHQEMFHGFDVDNTMLRIGSMNMLLHGVEKQKLDGVIKLPGGVFKPYAGVSTAILLFTKTNSGGTDAVWFYEVMADGWSLDDKRQPLLAEDKLGVVPKSELVDEEHLKNNLPDVLAQWVRLGSAKAEATCGERSRTTPTTSLTDRTLVSERSRTEQSFCVPKAEIAANGYDLSLNRYKEVIHEEVEHLPPLEVLQTGSLRIIG